MSPVAFPSVTMVLRMWVHLAASTLLKGKLRLFESKLLLFDTARFRSKTKRILEKEIESKTLWVKGISSCDC